MLKKLLAGVFSFGIAAVIAGGGSAFADGDLHKGEKPLKSYKSEATGVIVDVYATNPEEAELVKKEQGWSDNEPVKIMKDKGEKTATAAETAFNNVLSSSVTGFIKNFGTIKAEAGTDTGGWDEVGTEYWVMNADMSSLQWDQVHHSHGGDYMFRLPAHSKGSLQSGYSSAYGIAKLYEQDPTGNSYVTSWNYTPSSVSIDYVVRSISGWTDGYPDEAEFLTTHQGNYTISGGGLLYGVKYFD